MKTPITYYGGKQNMLKYILPHIPEHTTYVEPFAGGAALYFAKESSALSVINDKNKELINFYEISKTRVDELKKLIDVTAHSRSLYDDAVIVYTNPHLFDPVRRAWALWMLSKTSFSASLGAGFRFDKVKYAVGKALCNSKLIFDDHLCQKLSTTTIENDDALKIINRYDCSEAFFFIDPPYINCDQGHYSGYNSEDFKSLLDKLTDTSGKWMLTMYPDEILSKYTKVNSWRVVEVERHVSAPRTKKRKQVELIVMNY